MQLIACNPETSRLPSLYEEVNIFEVQEAVIESILRSSEYQQAASIAPKIVSEEQITVSEILSAYINQPDVSREEIRGLRKLLKQPIEGVYVTKIRQALQSFQNNQDFDALLLVIREIQSSRGNIDIDNMTRTPLIKREDLHLMCYEYICS